MLISQVLVGEGGCVPRQTFSFSNLHIENWIIIKPPPPPSPIFWGRCKINRSGMKESYRYMPPPPTSTTTTTVKGVHDMRFPRFLLLFLHFFLKKMLIEKILWERLPRPHPLQKRCTCLFQFSSIYQQSGLIPVSVQIVAI